MGLSYDISRYFTIPDVHQLQITGQRLVPCLPLARMDPGLVYIQWVRQYGVALNEWALNYGRSFKGM